MIVFNVELGFTAYLSLVLPGISGASNAASLQRLHANYETSDSFLLGAFPINT
jgi:hypothetical protein